jgi:hypothetical protein
VIVDPTLVPAESTDPTTDGGYISGHEAPIDVDGCLDAIQQGVL